jgi:pimeloyl-ACP methyl ester carboxylesterase
MKFLSGVLSLFLCTVLPGCWVVPIVQPAGKKDLSPRGLPGDTELVQVQTADGTVLRGLFIPAGKGAPVILHLLPSQTSITTGLGGGPLGHLAMDEFLLGLKDRGYSSLVIDCRGIGASEGDRSPEHLPEDAWAMWGEAVRRADDRPGHVILRAGSLGTIPAASLLERGILPGAAILIAPIRAETIAWHAPRQRRGAILGTLISLFLRQPVDVDLVSALVKIPVPVLLLLPETDEFLPPDEMDLVAEAAARKGNRVHRLPGEHLQLILRSHGYRFEKSGEDGFSGGPSREIPEPEEEFLESLDL